MSDTTTEMISADQWLRIRDAVAADIRAARPRMEQSTAVAIAEYQLRTGQIDLDVLHDRIRPSVQKVSSNWDFAPGAEDFEFFAERGSELLLDLEGREMFRASPAGRAVIEYLRGAVRAFKPLAEAEQLRRAEAVGEDAELINETAEEVAL